MKPTILITDSLFILPEQEAKIRSAGYEIERLDKPAATEEELSAAIVGKIGYILGGVEKVTEPVIDAADKLKAIVFTGTAAYGFITAHESATQKGIAIGSTPHMNAKAVAEFGATMTTAMIRNLFGFVRGSSQPLQTVSSMQNLTFGIVGFGHIGAQYARLMRGFGVTNIQYYNRTRKPELEIELGAIYKTKREVVESSDVLFVALPHDAGDDFFTAEDVFAIRKGSLIVSISEPTQFNLDAVYARLEKRELRLATDENIKEDRFQTLPLDVYYAPNASVAMFTESALWDVSESATQTLLNLLKTGDDQYLENPDYKLV
jgi:phosphoglycerate dehydrogenase-like enzyme